jgi:hypothetical protein
MGLTKESLLELRQNAVAKRQELLNMIQQANGAIDMLDHLLQQLEQPELEQQNDNAI